LLVDTVYLEASTDWSGLIMVGNGYGKQGVYSIKLRKWIAEPIHHFAQPLGDTLVVTRDDAVGAWAIPVYANATGKIRPYVWEMVPLVEAQIAPPCRPFIHHPSCNLFFILLSDCFLIPK
jgi:hypothetical protein